MMRRLFSSLFARLSLALLLLLLTIGGGFLVIERWSTRQYHEELTQRLNAPIAMYVTDQAELISNGEINTAELERLAERAMIINPSVEVYLLAEDGRILGHGLPPDAVNVQYVDLAPIKALIEGTRKMPVRGLDPRNPARNKVFSAHPVSKDGRLEGYLYVILGGSKYDELADSIRSSYAGTVSVSAIVALAAATFLAGLLVFGLLTRRLTGLTDTVQGYTDSDFSAEQNAVLASLSVNSSKPGEQDEITRLVVAIQTMAKKISELIDGLKETDRLRRELISNVSHDLRTPLSSMLGYVDTLLIKNGELSGVQREHFLRTVRNQTRRLESLIGDLFELSRLEANTIALHAEVFPLAELLQDVSQEFELEASNRNITITIEPGLERWQVRADIALVERVLENLLRNALDWTPDGGRIRLSVSAREKRVAVSVADTGCGIPTDQLDSVFERYYTVNKATKSQSKAPGNITAAGLGHKNSTGLGLAIVKRILDLHACQITVTSEVNKGTCFEFELPAAASA